MNVLTLNAEILPSTDQMMEVYAHTNNTLSKKFRFFNERPAL